MKNMRNVKEVLLYLLNVLHVPHGEISSGSTRPDLSLCPDLHSLRHPGHRAGWIRAADEALRAHAGIGAGATARNAAAATGAAAIA